MPVTGQFVARGTPLSRKRSPKAWTIVAACPELSRSGKKASVGHAFRLHAARAEAGSDAGGRAGGERGADEGRDGLADVREHLFGGDVFREVAAAVRRHEDFRAGAGLAFEHEAAEAAVGGHGGGEESGGAAADDREWNGFVREGHG